MRLMLRFVRFKNSVMSGCVAAGRWTMQRCSIGKRKLLLMPRGGVVLSRTPSYRTCSEAQSVWNHSSFVGFLTAALDPFRDPKVTVTPSIDPAGLRTPYRRFRYRSSYSSSGSRVWGDARVRVSDAE